VGLSWREREREKAGVTWSFRNVARERERERERVTCTRRKTSSSASSSSADSLYTFFSFIYLYKIYKFPPPSSSQQISGHHPVGPGQRHRKYGKPLLPFGFPLVPVPLLSRTISSSYQALTFFFLTLPD